MRICFIVHPNNKDTILDRIAHEIGKSFDEPIYQYGTEELPKSDHYFVTHYSMLPIVVAKYKMSLDYNLRINHDSKNLPITSFFTHNKGNIEQYIDVFNVCHAVVAESPQGMKELADLGVIQELLHFVPECADPNQFKPHSRTPDGAILVCGTNYADGRKNPELIYKVCELLKDKYSIIFCGNNWKDKSGFDIISRPYEEYPKVYSECSVYLSCSKLEGGGPNSLIEAMHANLVPVVSDTGNAREYITNGYNGYIFDKDVTPEQVAGSIVTGKH